MTEYNTFGVANMKSICRACLRVDEEVFPMIALEIDAYQSLTQKVADVESNMNLCLVCKWMLRKCIKFSQQCQRTQNLLKSVQESKSFFFPQQTSAYDLKISSLDSHYLGPECSLDIEDEKMEYMPLNDQIYDDDDDDDEELPLVMLQDEYKSKRKKIKNYELIAEPEIKQELLIKEEYTEEFCGKVRKRSKEKKKEVREGFSSRMVQETDEYIVIKLTKEQVLLELAEKAKVESYIRSPYKCDKCVKGFNFEDVLQTHMEKHSPEHGTYRCDICTQYCPSQVSLRGHLKSHTTRYKCKLCGQVRLSRQHLLEHHAITHTAAPTVYACDKCQFTTNKRTVIQRHVKMHAPGERHACHRCGKLFNTVESLRVHTMRHDKSKRLQCEHCDKHFIYPSLLLKHTQAVHERKDYYCVECDVRFKSPESLRLHFKKAKRHRDPSSYKHQCSECRVLVASAGALAAHRTGAHGAAPQHACAHGAAPQHACAHCRRRYSSRDALRAHAWRVHAHHKRKSVMKVYAKNHPQDCNCGGICTQTDSFKTQPTRHQQKQEGLSKGVTITSEMLQEG